MSAIRVRSSAAAGIRPTRPDPALSNELPRKSRGSPVPVLLALVFLAAGGYFGWKEFDRRRRIRLEREAAYERQMEEMRKREAAEAARLREEEAARKRAAAEEEERRRKAAEAKTVVRKRVQEKSEAEILLEEAAARKQLLVQVEEARKAPDAKPINGFAGVRFGEPLAKVGKPVKWGTVLDAGESVEKRGAAFAVWGEPLKKPFLTLGSRPLVWVTPKTLRPFRVEFSRPLALKPGEKHDPESTNVVAFIADRFKSKPFELVPRKPERKGCEFVLPIGHATVSVVESGNDLTFSVSREDIRQEALAEAETLRQEEKQVAEADGKALDSQRITGVKAVPDRKMYAGVKFKDETPRTFCGVFFACPPPESATIVVPQDGAKGFFLDYVRAKCPPFRGFTRGRADIDSARGGIYAVHLFSVGGEGGLDDREYFESVRAALEAHYKVKPTEKKGDLDLPELTFTVGDLDIVFGPDPRGGFHLDAVNQVLAKLADQAPAAPRTVRKRK